MLTYVSTPGGPSGQLPQKAQIHGGILRLPAIEPSDQGQYLCRALSSAGQHIARAMLQVHGERAGLEVSLGLRGDSERNPHRASVCRRQWTQGPGEPREDPGARGSHSQAVLQGSWSPQCQHHLEEGGRQPAPTGESTSHPRSVGSTVSGLSHLSVHVLSLLRLPVFPN